jgi:drug/metabolite transporter (DMT)-like permease
MDARPARLSPVPSLRTERRRRLVGIALMCGALICFSLLDASAKWLNREMDPLLTVWWRYASSVVLVSVVINPWTHPGVLRTRRPWLQGARSLLLFVSTALNFAALQYLQLAETMSIYFFAPMVITALAGPLLGEWAGWRRWMAVIAGFIGVLVITRPGVGAFEIGHVYAICSTLCYCSYVIMTRHMAASETAESLIFYSALAPVILMSPVVPYTASLPAELFHWVILISLGFFGGFGHWLLIKAYRQATTFALAPYPYLQMVWMVFFGYVIFDQFPDRYTLSGAAIIVASGLYIVHREHRLRLKSHTAPNTEDEELAKKL